MEDKSKMLKDCKVKPLFKVVAIAEDGWSDEILERSGGRVHSVYLLDERQHTYICSAQANYACHYLYAFPERHLEDESKRSDLMDDIDEAMRDAPQLEYFACGLVDAIASEHQKIVTDYSLLTDDELEISYDEALEECLEFAQGNHLI
jgi:hypothetical protein